jgi:hypothetical protein
MQGPKINKNSKNSTRNNHYSQVVVLFCIYKQLLYTKIRPLQADFTFKFGGAAGHCPPVQKVTDYSSTSIVCLKYL